MTAIVRKHFVHRYKWSHDKRRQQFKGWRKKGYVTLTSQDVNGFIYTENSECDWTIHRKVSQRKVLYYLVKKL